MINQFDINDDQWQIKRKYECIIQWRSCTGFRPICRFLWVLNPSHHHWGVHMLPIHWIFPDIAASLNLPKFPHYWGFPNGSCCNLFNSNKVLYVWIIHACKIEALWAILCRRVCMFSPSQDYLCKEKKTSENCEHEGSILFYFDLCLGGPTCAVRTSIP